jgi:hypothetical protein
MVTVTGAHLTPQGDAVMVNGLVDGVETSILASDVTIDGTPFDGRVSSLAGPLEDIRCFKCDCRGRTCLCVPIVCPK